MINAKETSYKKETIKTYVVDIPTTFLICWKTLVKARVQCKASKEFFQ